MELLTDLMHLALLITCNVYHVDTIIMKQLHIVDWQTLGNKGTVGGP